MRRMVERGRMKESKEGKKKYRNVVRDKPQENPANGRTEQEVKFLIFFSF